MFVCSHDGGVPEFNLQEVIGTYEASLCQGHVLQQMVPCCIAQPKVH